MTFFLPFKQSNEFFLTIRFSVCLCSTVVYFLILNISMFPLNNVLSNTPYFVSKCGNDCSHWTFILLKMTMIINLLWSLLLFWTDTWISHLALARSDSWIPRAYQHISSPLLLFISVQILLSALDAPLSSLQKATPCIATNVIYPLISEVQFKFNIWQILYFLLFCQLRYV